MFIYFCQAGHFGEIGKLSHNFDDIRHIQSNECDVQYIHEYEYKYFSIIRIDC